MRVIRSEKIFLSQKEADIWVKFDQILEGLGRECKNPSTIESIDNVQFILSELWKKIEMEE